MVDVDDRGKKKEEGIHCIICNKLCKNAYGLANHVTKTHRMSFPEYKRRVSDAAVREIGTLKAFAGGDFFERECRCIRHLFLLLKEEWK